MCQSSLKSSNKIIPFRRLVNAKLDFFFSPFLPIKYPQLSTKSNADSAKNCILPHNKTMFQNIPPYRKKDLETVSLCKQVMALFSNSALLMSILFINLCRLKEFYTARVLISKAAWVQKL